jgi:competence protein ComEC
MRYNTYILLLILLSIGVFRSIFASQTTLIPESRVKCIGTINRFPIVKNTYQSIEVFCKELEVNLNGEVSTLHDTPVKANTQLYPSLQYGNRLSMEGKINHYGILSSPKLSLQKSQPQGITFALYQLRLQLEKTVKTYLPSQNATLVIGTLLGSTDSFSEDITSQLKQTGTIHMVVVSGYNVSLVAGLILGLSGFVHRKIAIVCSIAGVVAFVILTGAEPPAIRAGLMGGIVLFGQFTGRKSSTVYLLLLTASAYFAFTPQIISELSFQLSCLATAGILLLPDIFQGFVLKISQSINNKKIGKAVSIILSEAITTISAQTAVAPLIAIHFNQVSLIALPANIAVGWSVPYIMLSGVMLIIVGIISPVLAELVSYIPIIFTAYFLQMVKLFAETPFSSFNNFKINWMLVLSYYIFLVLLITKNYKDKIYSKGE